MYQINYSNGTCHFHLNTSPSDWENQKNQGEMIIMRIQEPYRNLSMTEVTENDVDYFITIDRFNGNR